MKSQTMENKGNKMFNKVTILMMACFLCGSSLQLLVVADNLNEQQQYFGRSNPAQMESNFLDESNSLFQEQTNQFDQMKQLLTQDIGDPKIVGPNKDEYTDWQREALIGENDGSGANSFPTFGNAQAEEQISSESTIIEPMDIPSDEEEKQLDQEGLEQSRKDEREPREPEEQQQRNSPSSPASSLPLSSPPPHHQDGPIEPIGDSESGENEDSVDPSTPSPSTPSPSTPSPPTQPSFGARIRNFISSFFSG